MIHLAVGALKPGVFEASNSHLDLRHSYTSSVPSNFSFRISGKLRRSLLLDFPHLSCLCMCVTPVASQSHKQSDFTLYLALVCPLCQQKTRKVGYLSHSSLKPQGKCVLRYHLTVFLHNKAS